MQQYESIGLGFMAIRHLSLSNICKSNESDLVRIFNKIERSMENERLLGSTVTRELQPLQAPFYGSNPLCNAKRNLILFSNPVNLLEIYR